MSGRRAKRQSGHPARAGSRGAPPSLRKPLPKSKGTRAPSRPNRTSQSRTSLTSRLGGWWTSVLQRKSPGFSPARPLPELDRRDLVWAALTGVASAPLFATVLTSHPYLGDATETVAGVSSLGILHDPGYPTYVLAAHLFTLLVPIGNEAFRVNLFSLFCASLTVGGVQLLARRCGVPRWAAVIGALALAASAGFWFYSGFAKHDLFSGLLLLITLHLALAWWAQPTTRRLVALAATVGLGLGSSWPLELTILPTIAFVLFASRRQLSVRSLASATATGLVVLVAIYGFVMVRAAQNPPVNWGGATTISRLWELVNRADFTAPGSSARASSAPKGLAWAPTHSPIRGASAPAATITTSAAVTDDVLNYAVIFGRELGVLALLLAAFGLLASLTWRRTAASYPVLIAFLANLIAARAVVNFGGDSGSLDTDLIDEGFVLGCYFALACWLAIGAAELVGAPGRVAITGRLKDRLRRPLVAVGQARLFVPAAALALGAAVVVPLVLGNWSGVQRSSKPFADDYAQAVFSELPPHAAVFILGANLTQPLIYRQVVYHQRRDVEVVAVDGLEFGWYRQQLRSRLGIRLPAPTGAPRNDAVRTMSAVAHVRPVYLDPQTVQTFSSVIGYRPVGLLSQLASGHGQAPVSAPAEPEQRLLAAERQAGFPDHNWNIWPNDAFAQEEYAAATLHVAQAYYQRRDFVGMRRVLLNDLKIEPGDPTAEGDLAQLARSGHTG